MFAAKPAIPQMCAEPTALGLPESFHAAFGHELQRAVVDVFAHTKTSASWGAYCAPITETSNSPAVRRFSLTLHFLEARCAALRVRDIDATSLWKQECLRFRLSLQFAILLGSAKPKLHGKSRQFS